MFYVCLGLKAVTWPEREVDQERGEQEWALGRRVLHQAGESFNRWQLAEASQEMRGGRYEL